MYVARRLRHGPIAEAVVKHTHFSPSSYFPYISKFFQDAQAGAIPKVSSNLVAPSVGALEFTALP